MTDGVEYWPVDFARPDYDPVYQRVTTAYVVTVNAAVRRCFAEYEAEDIPQPDRAAAKVAEINTERDRRLTLGAAHQGKRFSMSDSSRTDQSGMATTAGLVLLGALPWPDDYALGWIALDNSRLPLPTPQDGIALAAKVAITYSALVQHARTLKDAALKSADPAAIDHLAGWPDDPA